MNNKNKSDVLPNRKEYRASMRHFKHLRAIKKSKTKGAFGAISEYIRESRKKEAVKKAQNQSFDKESTQVVEAKEVTKEKIQPIETKEVTKIESGVETEVDQVFSDKKDNNETDVAE